MPLEHIYLILSIMKYFFAAAVSIMFFSSCEKKISFNLNSVTPLLVVDAQIENDKAPVVVLTKSFGYFNTLSAQALSASFVHGATVMMSNGTLTQQLKEYTVFLGNGYSAYYYSIDTTNLSQAFNGAFNSHYSLDIKTEGQEYISSTTIPLLTKHPDSLWFVKAPMNPDSNARILMTRTTDPPGLGNYIRYFTKRNNDNFLPGPNSVYDDAVIDGTTYTISVDPGIDRNNPVNGDNNFFRKGDTVTVKVCDIDKATYTFWNTWEFAQQSLGNPFAQPNKVIGNISNGALGAFYGYAGWYHTLVAR